MKVSFYKLTNGGFSPSFYNRSDGRPDITRDWPLIEVGGRVLWTAMDCNGNGSGSGELA
jgi:hypothetical protein